MAFGMVAQATADGKLLHSVSLALDSGVYVLRGRSLGITSGFRSEVDAARRLRSAAAVALKRGEAVELIVEDMPSVRGVVDLLNVLPAGANIKKCIYWCSTTRQFFRAQHTVQTNDGRVWAYCAKCDTNGRSGAGYDATQAQPHPATMGGAA